jgi:hypothetical protein
MTLGRSVWRANHSSYKPENKERKRPGAHNPLWGHAPHDLRIARPAGSPPKSSTNFQQPLLHMGLWEILNQGIAMDTFHFPQTPGLFLLGMAHNSLQGNVKTPKSCAVNQFPHSGQASFLNANSLPRSVPLYNSPQEPTILQTKPPDFSPEPSGPTAVAHTSCTHLSGHTSCCSLPLLDWIHFLLSRTLCISSLWGSVQRCLVFPSSSFPSWAQLNCPLPEVILKASLAAGLPQPGVHEVRWEVGSQKEETVYKAGFWG